ncbi:PREDICTED: protein Hook homolog 3 [Dinoponera quadriceps]|uniref:Protein Hook homolog 3 n=1 Tax=Dinoponera quadriceps TaxID=609295 RepID=A0A6P3XXC2_DINQU|nr:PREDICTED: protein Hook homolog 3 [Dinoponera quadriceps]
MMQIKANIARMKYRSVCSELREKSVFYASSLKDLEDGIRQQEIEIKRLQGVKEEAIELRDTTQETLVKEEIEETNSSKRRDSVIKEYRQRVSERKMELERLERMIFHTRPRDDFETREKSRVQMQEDIIKDELARLEEAFAKLRNATGVSKSEEVLNRFLGQQATKDSLQKMRAATEQEKMLLEKNRQELSAEIEMRKFSETKSAEQNAEIVTKLNSQIDEQRARKERAEAANRRVGELLNEVTGILRKLYEKFQVRVINYKFTNIIRARVLQHNLKRTKTNERNLHLNNYAINSRTKVPRFFKKRKLVLKNYKETALNPDIPLPEDTEMDDPLIVIELLNGKITHGLEVLSVSDKYLEAMDEVLLDKMETMSVATTSAEGRTMRANGGPLFPRFPPCATPAAALSEDEEEVPSRNVLKRQAQLLVDTKSRRKGFAFKR